ncbi:hypothetical protein BFR57_08060 [Idiomarina sp. MD25a]|uniref:DUF885 domain-containing protein n=1 Tax=Idiomarina sp. MD25a TaxID=1889913 RepID=UPI0008F83A5B|nr:DUF885 domain-containing protein [Idiomarina sp. MD25a]OIN01997.1 hypothetical protein BFR57_08060 [Idiomarina sp. MD25a]
MKHSLIVLALAGFLASCGDAPQQTQSTKASSSIKSVSVSQKLDELYTHYFDESLSLNPLTATYIGRTGYNDKLPNFLSPAHRQQQLELEQKYLDKIDSIDIDSLTEKQKISYQIFRQDRIDAIEGSKFPAHLIPINQFYNIANQYAMLGSGTSAQPFNNAADYANWAARMHQIPVIFDQAIENMRNGVKQGVVQPKVLIEKAIAQIRAQQVRNIKESIFWRPVDDLPQTLSEQQKQTIRAQYNRILSDEVLPAYQRLADYLEEDYLPHTRTKSFGIGQLPNGKAWYQHQIKVNTSIDISADKVHQLGKQEVARIHDEMRKIMREVDFEGDLKQFFDFMTNDDQFIYPSRQAMLEDYRSLRAKVDERVPQLFNIFPKADYEVRPVERFREQSASSGSYQSAPQDNSRPAVFYLNTYDLSSRPTWAKTALFLHEAAPGHHFQISIQQELKDLPLFRKYGRETAYTEGWGLYAESLGDELGLYQNPYQRFGALAAELWRSIRLVTDTGIHDKGWTRQQVLEYMYDNAPVAEARAVSEAERFMALPGQALAYKIGQLKIAELRRMAEQKLGAKFDIKSFHRVVLEDGALPLFLLEKKVRLWIAQQL